VHSLALDVGEWVALCSDCFTIKDNYLIPIGYAGGWVLELVWTWWQKETSLSLPEVKPKFIS
jgi:hypothetical protein